MNAKIIDIEEAKARRMAALRVERLADIFSIDVVSGRIRIDGTIEEVSRALATGQINEALWVAEAAL